MRVFTKSFFRLSWWDQAQVVAAVIRDLTTPNYLNKDDERKAPEQARRIAKKARDLNIAVPEGILAGGKEVRNA